MSDILKDTKKFDKLQASMEVDAQPQKKTISIDEVLTKKEKPKKLDLSKNSIPSLNWSPDKSFKNVPLEKLNPFVYTQKEMEGFREEYKSRWEKWFGSAPFVFLGMVSSLIIVITLLLRKKN